MPGFQQIHPGTSTKRRAEVRVRSHASRLWPADPNFPSLLAPVYENPSLCLTSVAWLERRLSGFRKGFHSEGSYSMYLCVISAFANHTSESVALSARGLLQERRLVLLKISKTCLPGHQRVSLNFLWVSFLFSMK